MQREAAADIELGKSLIQRAREMVPVLAERAERAENERRIPPETIADFKRAGFFRVLQSRRYGGYELHPNIFFEIQMTLAQGCMSSGWVYGVVGVHNWQLALFDPRAAEDVWGKDTSTLIASTYMPQGQVKRVEGGFQFSGRWGFSSGIDHGEWVFLGGIVPADEVNSVPQFRTFLLPRADIQIVDNWYTMGLKGTGSKQVVVKDAFVPEYRTHNVLDGFSATSPGLSANPAPLYHLPFGQVFVRAVSSASIGALQGALTAFRDYGSKRISSNDFSRTAEDPVAEHAAADAAIAIAEMKQGLFASFDSMMAKLGRGEALDLNDRIHYRYQSALAADRCVAQVDRLFNSCGGQGVYVTNPVTRFFLDIHAARMHYANNPDKLGRNYGGVLMGLKNSDFFI
ncbi:MAG TPA: hypothetical protein VIX59_05080 [Candidatus Binataceae bacterium]